jgi:hypothetical protein
MINILYRSSNYLYNYYIMNIINIKFFNLKKGFKILYIPNSLNLIIKKMRICSMEDLYFHLIIIAIVTKDIFIFIDFYPFNFNYFEMQTKLIFLKAMIIINFIIYIFSIIYQTYLKYFHSLMYFNNLCFYVIFYQ